METIVRLASVDDVESIGSMWDEFMVYLRAINEDYWEVRNGRSEFVDYLASVLDSADVRIVVAESEKGETVGFALGLIDTLPEWFGSRRIGLIRYVAVSADVREQGIGQSLVDHLIAWYRSVGIERVELYVLAGLPAEGFWSRQGFKPFMDRRFITL